MYFEELAAAIDALEVPPTCEALAEIAALRDRLDAKVAPAIAAVDDSGEWSLEGAASMVCWLRNAARISGGEAKALVAAASKMARLPVTAAAWEAGDLSSAQVRVISACVHERRVELFASHEEAVVPALAPLSVRQTVCAMTLWRERADALEQGPAEPEFKRSLRISRTLDDRRDVIGSFDAFSGQILERALALATTRDADDEVRSPRQRQGDALIDIARFFLDNQKSRTGGRHRPHLNVVVDVSLPAEGGRFDDGSVAPAAVIDTLICDCNLHRVLVKGRSGILDYGRSARTAPPDLFNALVLRDGGCREPGCDRPPSWCDAHHVRTWDEEAGPTSVENMVLRCSRHHHQWHRRRKAGWTERLEPDGTLVIRDDGVRTFISRPYGAVAQRDLFAS